MIVFIFLSSLSIHQSVAQLAQFNTPTCGLTHLPDDMVPPAQARIYRGTPVDQPEMPWVVRIEMREFRRPLYVQPLYSQCTGSILNNWWVITAAHCLMVEDATGHFDWTYPGNIEIQAGWIQMGPNITAENTNRTREFPIRTLEVGQFFTHPEYKFEDPADYSDCANDLALILLRKEQYVIFEAETRRFLLNHICLPTGPPNMQVSYQISGYGMLGEVPNRLYQLMTYTAPILTAPQCQSNGNQRIFDYTEQILRQYNPTINVVMPPGYLAPFEQLQGEDPRIVCTVAMDYTCEGDSCGPLAYLNQNGRWELAGVTQAGESVGDDDLFNDVLRVALKINNPNTARLLFDRYTQDYPCGHLNLFNVIHEYRAWIEQIFLANESPANVGAAPVICLGVILVSGIFGGGYNYYRRNQETNQLELVEQGQVGPGQLAEGEVVGAVPQPVLCNDPGYYCGPAIIQFDPATKRPGTVLPKHWPGYLRIPEGQPLPFGYLPELVAPPPNE